MRFIGIILVFLGSLAIVSQGFTYVTREELSTDGETYQALYENPTPSSSTQRHARQPRGSPVPSADGTSPTSSGAWAAAGRDGDGCGEVGISAQARCPGERTLGAWCRRHLRLVTVGKE